MVNDHWSLPTDITDCCFKLNDLLNSQSVALGSVVPIMRYILVWILLVVISIIFVIAWLAL